MCTVCIYCDINIIDKIDINKIRCIYIYIYIYTCISYIVYMHTYIYIFIIDEIWS